MPARLVLRSLVVAALLATGPAARADTTRSFFQQYAAQPNALAQRQFLTAQLPQLDPAQQQLARQLLATADAELGLYEQALRDFPFDQREPLRVRAPQRDANSHSLDDDARYIDNSLVARAVPAAPAIAQAARGRRLVLINEAHHDAHTRVLVLALLPLLRAEGYNYFAAEALVEDGATLMQRGYPVADSGSEYLHEPLYGEILRQAVRLGYTVVAYDPAHARSDADREIGQAVNLNARVFAHDPKARLFALVGYAHNGKARGQLGEVSPMAMRLAGLAGIEPLSIDQTSLRAIDPEPANGAYRQITAIYHPRQPILLHPRGSRQAGWSSDPARYDLSVILPPPHGEPRPSWLSLGGARHATPIDTSLCAGILPCVVEARYASESADAIPADRYAFLVGAVTRSELYLYPGRYRLRAWGADGKTLGERELTVE